MTDITKTALEQQLALKAIEATEAATQCMIDWLDALRGDADLEDATDAEDEGIQPHLLRHERPGCDVGDPGDNSCPEWHTLGRHKAVQPMRSLPHEDAEDDDPAEEDDPADTGNAEDEAITGEVAHYATRDAGPGCIVSDEDHCPLERGETGNDYGLCS